MKVMRNFLILVAIAITHSGCELIESGSKDQTCGESAALAVDIYRGSLEAVDLAYYGIVNEKISFIFNTPDWLFKEPICPYEPIKADFTVGLNSEYLDDVQGIEMLGEITIGYRSYPVTLTINGNAFHGVKDYFELGTFDPYYDSGVGYVKGDVIIKFPYSGDAAADKQKLKNALNRAVLILTIHRPKI
jgi:hypothetical protein